MAIAEGTEPLSLKKDPIKGADAWKLFRRNKAAVVALAVIIADALDPRLRGT